MGKLLRKLRKHGATKKDNAALARDVELVVAQCKQMDRINKWVNNELDRAVEFMLEMRCVCGGSGKEHDEACEIYEWMHPYVNRIEERKQHAEQEMQEDRPSA